MRSKGFPDGVQHAWCTAANAERSRLRHEDLECFPGNSEADVSEPSFRLSHPHQPLFTTHTVSKAWGIRESAISVNISTWTTWRWSVSNSVIAVILGELLRRCLTTTRHDGGVARYQATASDCNSETKAQIRSLSNINQFHNCYANVCTRNQHS